MATMTALTETTPLHLVAGPSRESQTEHSFLQKCFRKRKTDKDNLPSWSRRMGLFLFAMVQNGLGGGVIYGWSSIDHTILAAPLNEGGAGLNLHQTTLMFSLASSVAMVASLLLGALLDMYGPRACAVTSSLIVAAGCLVFAFAQEANGLAVGICCIAFGGPGLGCSILHLANLFPGNEYLTMSCLGGSVALSFSMFAFFDYLWNEFEVVTLGMLFRLFALLILLVAVGAFLLYPDEPFEEFEEIDGANPTVQKEMDPLDLDPIAANADHEHHGSHSHRSHEKHNVDYEMFGYPYNHPLHEYHGRELPNTTEILPLKSFLDDGLKIFMAPEQPEFVDLKEQPFHVQLFSGAYCRCYLVFMVTCFLANLYVVPLSTELADQQVFSVETQHTLSRSFSFIMSMGVLGAILVGWLMDRIGLESCTAITLVLGQLQIVLILLCGHSETAMIASFWVYSFFRQFLFPVFMATVSNRLGFSYFGILLGVAFASAGLAQLLLVSLVSTVDGDCHESTNAVCDAGHWKALHVVEFVILGVLLVVPLVEHRDRKATERWKRRRVHFAEPNGVSYGTNV